MRHGLNAFAPFPAVVLLGALFLAGSGLAGCGDDVANDAASPKLPAEAEADAGADTAPASGTVTLVWTPPTTNTDGTPISNLAGYTINYGTESSALDQTVEVAEPTSTTYTLSNLPSGTWYFAVSSVNGDGIQSSLTPVVSKTLP